MTALAAVLAVALVVQTVRLRAALGEGAAARDVAVSSLLFAVAASAEAQRRRVELVALAGRALDLESSISRVNRRDLDATGTVTDGGAMLACAVLQLRVDIDEVQRGRDGQ